MSHDLHSRRGLAWRLGFPLAELLDVAADIEGSYREFRRKRPGRSDRVIDNPNERMKEIQRRARRLLLEPLPLDDSAHGCVKGGSARTSSEIHCGQRNLARIDVKHCFPSVTNRMVFRLLCRSGFGPRVASLLTVLMTRQGHIPQGAPSSDRLANLVLRPVDQRVREIAGTLNLKHGRFVDDFALSGDQTRDAIGEVIAALRAAGFAVGHAKTGNAGAHSPHVSTGYSATPHGVKITHEKQQEIRSRVYQTVVAHRRGEPIEQLLKSVRGSLAYLRPTNPGLVRRLESQLAKAGIELSPPNRSAQNCTENRRTKHEHR